MNEGFCKETEQGCCDSLSAKPKDLPKLGKEGTNSPDRQEWQGQPITSLVYLLSLRLPHTNHIFFRGPRNTKAYILFLLIRFSCRFIQVLFQQLSGHTHQMFRPTLSVLNWSFRSRSSFVLTRAISTFSPSDHAVLEPVDKKIPNYLKNLASQQRMRELSFTPNDPRERRKKKARSRKDTWDAGEDSEKNLQTDVDSLLEKSRRERGASSEELAGERLNTRKNLPEFGTEIELTVSEISSGGDGLALSEDGNRVYVVPFTVPGDKALVKVVNHKSNYSISDFIKVIEAGPQRDDTQIKCQYFGQCSGCQLQMLSYKDQLEHKKKVVEKAYANYSGLIPEVIPTIGDTFPSPLQYGYRTKLTPHFGMGGRFKRSSPKTPLTEVPPIGFNIKNRGTNMDIEDCPLGTEIVRRGFKKERKRVAENISNYNQGATILLRESTRRIPKSEFTRAASTDLDDVIYNTDHPDYVEEKRYVMDHNGYVVEYVDDFELRNKAGAFFQNNNSILSGFTEYMRQQVHPKERKEGEKPIKYLIDAYSGCGLFTVALSKMFKSSLGIDIDQHSIINARENAKKNNLPNTGFAAADASLLFEKVPYPSDETVIVIDPPRKGCSKDFLDQLLEFGPRRIAYVSCNVHTQARDVGYLVQGDSSRDIRYDIESIRGFDFFPQTGHVEGLAILNRVPKPSASSSSSSAAVAAVDTVGNTETTSVEKEA